MKTGATFCLFFLAALGVFFFMDESISAQSMSSSNFKVSAGSTNCGGAYSTSTNFRVFDSLCDLAPGTVSSTNYVADSGFQAMKDIPFLTVTVTGSSVGFGTLSTSAVASGSVTSTVTTNSFYGYQSTIITNGNFRTGKGDSFTNASTGDTITAGSGKYGVQIVGTNAALSNDNGISSAGKVFASNTSPVSAVATTVIFKAAPSTTTPGGSYTQTVTLITTATF